MKYLHPEPFSTPAATDEYRDGWERVFAKKPVEIPEALKPAIKAACDLVYEPQRCPCESGELFTDCHGKP